MAHPLDKPGAPPEHTPPVRASLAARLTLMSLGLLIAAGCGDTAPEPPSRDTSSPSPLVGQTHAPPSPLVGDGHTSPSPLAGEGRGGGQDPQRDASIPARSRDHNVPTPGDDTAAIATLHSLDESAGTRRHAAPTVERTRPPDDRPMLDDSALETAGIRRYDSERCILYTDLDPEIAGRLPPLVDHAYEVWVAYFGEPPPASDGSRWQITGYLMVDPERFRTNGLLPDRLPGFLHGRAVRYEFWMNDQEHDYYRRHLFLHEATHCFMYTMDPEYARGAAHASAWYMEGMAELFATHRLEGDRLLARHIPLSREESEGWGRTRLIADAVAADRGLPLDALINAGDEVFIGDQPLMYAWSWGLTYFLDNHPRYRDRFRTLGGEIARPDFDQHVADLFADDMSELAEEWQVFAATVTYGYDVERCAIDFTPGPGGSGTGVPPVTGATVAIAADRGWQNTGIEVTAGDTYNVFPTGRYSIADEPRTWWCEAGGITFRYHDGLPIGRLVAAVRDPEAFAAHGVTTLLDVHDVGLGPAFVPRHSGTLYLRINDAWGELADNRGELQVHIEPAR